MDEARKRVVMGTCSWTDDSLLRCGRFYPGFVKTNDDRLVHYSTFFPCVEVDTSLYAMPSASNVEKWCKLVPKEFVFHFKAYGLFAQQAMSVPSLPYVVKQMMPTELLSSQTLTLASLPEACKTAAWSAYNAALLPAHTAGKLGAVVLQFHVGFKPTEANREHICYCRRELDGRYTMAVEFRDRAWLWSCDTEQCVADDGGRAGVLSDSDNDGQLSDSLRINGGNVDGQGSQKEKWSFSDTLDFLRSHSIVYICADELQREMPNQSHVASDAVVPIRAGVASRAMAYVRLHRRQGTERLLAPDELSRWAARIQTLSRTVDGPIYFLLSTAHEDQAIVNAKRLAGALGPLAFDWQSHYREAQRKKGGLLSFVTADKKGQRRATEVPTSDGDADGACTGQLTDLVDQQPAKRRRTHSENHVHPDEDQYYQQQQQQPQQQQQQHQQQQQQHASNRTAHAPASVSSTWKSPVKKTNGPPKGVPQITSFFAKKG